MLTPVTDYNKVELGEGLIIANFDTANELTIGATRGDSVFTITRNIKDIPVDGTLGKVKSGRRLVEENATLKIAALELAANFKNLFAGLSEAGGTGNAAGYFGAAAYTKTVSNLAVSDADYLTNIAFVGLTKGGKPIAAIVKNALGDGNIAMSYKNKDEVVAETTFTGHYESSGAPASMWEKRYYTDVFTGDVTPPTVVTTPADAATGIVVTADVVWTFNEAIDPTTITTANFLLIKTTDGTIVAGALTYSADKTVVTFNPTSSLSGATVYNMIATTNVKDIAGNALATVNISNFTTA